MSAGALWRFYWYSYVQSIQNHRRALGALYMVNESKCPLERCGDFTGIRIGHANKYTAPGAKSAVDDPHLEPSLPTSQTIAAGG